MVDLVGGAGIASAVGRCEAVINASRVLGPAVGAILSSTLGAAARFGVSALTFLAPLLVLLRHRARSGANVPVPRTAELRNVSGVPAIRACVLLAAAGGTLFT